MVVKTALEDTADHRIDCLFQCLVNCLGIENNEFRAKVLVTTQMKAKMLVGLAHVTEYAAVVNANSRALVNLTVQVIGIFL